MLASVISTPPTFSFNPNAVAPCVYLKSTTFPFTVASLAYPAGPNIPSAPLIVTVLFATLVLYTITSNVCPPTSTFVALSGNASADNHVNATNTFPSFIFHTGTFTNALFPIDKYFALVSYVLLPIFNSLGFSFPTYSPNVT